MALFGFLFRRTLCAFTVLPSIKATNYQCFPARGAPAEAWLTIILADDYSGDRLFGGHITYYVAALGPEWSLKETFVQLNFGGT